MNIGAALAAVLVVALPAVGRAEPVAAYSGVGDATTPRFQVEDGWEIRWKAEGREFELILAGTDEHIPSIVADQIEAGGGVRNYIQGGTYYFAIRANGPWRVEVRQR